jgi:protocatechuate 3,4-dioxygenase beta subunit
MLRAKRLAAVFVAAVLTAGLLPADVVAGSGGAAAPTAPTVQADIAPVQPVTTDGQPLADDLDPNAALTQALSVPDPLSHVPDSGARGNALISSPNVPLTLKHVSASAVTAPIPDKTTSAPIPAVSSTLTHGVASAPQLDVAATDLAPSVSPASADKVVSGVVHDPGDSPVAGIQIRLCASSTLDCTATAQATTAADGSFSAAVPRGDYYAYFIDPLGRYTALYRYVSDASGGGLGTIALGAAVHVSGVVSDTSPTHLPVAGIAVSIPGFAAVLTDNDGAFSIAVTSGSYVVRFRDPSGVRPTGYYSDSGFAPVNQGTMLVVGADLTGIDVAMPTYLHIRGTIRDRELGGIAGAIVTVGATLTAVSAMNGDYDVSVWPSGLYTIEIHSEHTGHVPDMYYSLGTFVVSGPAPRSSYDIHTDINGLDVVMPRTPSILGRVTDTAGAPIEGALVEALIDGTGRYSDETKADGTYLLGVSDGDCVGISANAQPTYMSSTLGYSVCVGRGTWQTGKDLTLTAYAHIKGTVTDIGGVAIRDVVVTAKPTAWNPFPPQVSAGSDGTFDVRVEPGSYTLSISDPSGVYADGCLGASGWVLDCADAKIVVLASGETRTVHLEMPPYRYIRGSLTYSNGVSATGDVTAFINPTFQYGWASVTGAFAIKVPPGTYKVEAFLTGEPWWYNPGGSTRVSSLGAPVVVSTDDVSGIDIVIPADRTVSGVMKYSGGGAATSVSYRIYDLFGTRLASGTTDANGSFSVALRPGKYLLGASGSSSYAAVWYGPGGYAVSSADAAVLDVTTGSISGITVLLPALQTLSGAVSGPGSSRPGGIYVEAWVDGVFYADATTDDVGRYALAVPPGSASLWFFDLSSALAGGWYMGGPALTNDWQMAAKLVVSARPITGINVSMSAAHYILGRFAAGEIVEAVVNGSDVSLGIANSYGYFGIAVGPGDYRIYEPGTADIAAGWYASSGFALDAQGATVVHVSSTDVVLDSFAVPSGWHIEGQVTNEDANPLKALVEVWHGGSVYAYADAQGWYSALVPAGQFTLAFVDLELVYGSGWYSIRGLVRDRKDASAVSPGVDSVDDIDVVLPYLVPPGKPTGVAAGGFHNGAVVTWSAPADDGGTDITKYTVTSSPAGKTCTSISETRCIVYGLTNGTAYTFTVKATNAVGTGAASDPSGAVVPSPVPGPPGTPSAVAGNAAASVTWTPPAVPGGSAVSAYTVTSSPGGKTCATTGALSCKVTGLTNGTAYTFSVTATNATGTGPASAPSAPVKPIQPASYHPMTPVRLVDTRISGTALTGKIAANSPRGFRVAGASGIPANAVAITANLTVTNPTYAWAMYLGPDPAASPSTSTINFVAGQTLANGVTVALTSSGYLYATYMSASGNTTDMVLDVSGYFTADTSGDTYHPIAPVRDLDSRYSTGLSGKFTANTPRGLKVGGINGVPTSAKAVTGNITVTGSSFGWALYAGPAPVASPKASTLNFLTGQVASNNLTVALSTDGQIYITFLSIAGAKTDVVFDVTGYYTADQTGYSFMPITPVRLLDTRVGNGLAGKLPVNKGKHFQVTGRNVIPPASEGVAAITGNATIVNETAGWAIYVGPADLDKPTTSALNFVAGDIKANGITVSLGPSGSLSITYIGAGSNTTDLVVDVTGYFVR